MIAIANRMETLRALAQTKRSQVDRRKGERDKLLSQRQSREATLNTTQASAETTKQVIMLLNEASRFGKDQARQQVETLATLALQSVFGPGYRFVLEMTKRGDNDEVKCYVASPTDDGTEFKTEGTDSRGGGIVDIQSLALRMAMLETYQTPKGGTLDGALILDEPGKHVSKQFIALLGRFIKAVCEQFGRQVIMVTHNEELANMADARFDVILVDNVSEVTGAA